jgi:hypothetical protein
MASIQRHGAEERQTGVMSISESTREYDSFGPWPLEVLSAEDVPRLFRTHPLDFAAARLILKVPREIERRNATPAMDLYDTLLVAEPDRLTVLNRDGETFTTSHTAYESMALIENSINLLDGRLRIVSRDGGDLVIPFNGSTRILIVRLIDLLRESARVATQGRRLSVGLSPVAPVTREGLGEADVALTAAYQDFSRALEGVTYYGGYGRRTLVPTVGGARGAALRFRPAVLHAVLAFGTDRELHLLSRRERIVRSRIPVLSITHTIIEVARVDRVGVDSHPLYVGVDIVTLRMGSAEFSFEVDRGSRVEAALLALGSRAG